MGKRSARHRWIVHDPHPQNARMWTGKAVIGSGWALFAGAAGDHAPHRHHAVQLAVGVRGPIRLWARGAGDLAAAAAVIPADLPHRLVPDPAPVLLLYVERESRLGRRLDERCGGRARPLGAAAAQDLAAPLRDPQSVDATALDRAVSLILGTAKRQSPDGFADARIARSLAELPRPLPAALAAATLARQAGLSASRYAHLFRAHTGMALRPYLRWLRLQHALAEIARGRTLTEAAYHAGFADSAHLSRTFRRTFGIAPRALRHPALSLSPAAQPIRSSGRGGATLG
ncbi:MAG: helix-turn-helix transcriptional regulator [Gammaproteobacteria bacterium]|nr:helix-turn-helix transcriptional regulator [Gammaproteobacteria bacterium]